MCCCTLSAYIRDRPSFPTRRSSDLVQATGHRAGIPCGSRRGRSGRGGCRAEPGRGAPRSFFLQCREIIGRSEEHTSELQSRGHLVCRLLLEKKKKESRGAKRPMIVE